MRYPLDFDELQKGDVIERARLIDVLGRMPEGKFKLAVLQLARLVEEECLCTCKMEHDGKTGDLLRLRLLTDPEAAHYNPKVCDRHLKGFGRRLKLAMRVDQSQLSAQEKTQLEQQLLVKSRQFQALRAARRREITGPAPQAITGGQQS